MLTPKTLYTDLTKLNAKIDAFGKAGVRLQTEAHKLASSVLLHLAKNKDTRVLSRFMLVIPDMVRTNGLRAWFEEFGNVRFVYDEDHPERPEEIVLVKDKAVRLSDGIAKPFWKFTATEGKPYQPVDRTALLNSVIDKLSKDTAKTGIDHMADIKALRALLNPEVRMPQAFNPAEATVDPLTQIN